MTAPRWKFWGWGYEGSGLVPDEARRLLQFYADRFGLDEAAPRLAPMADEIVLRRSRLEPPARLAHRCSTEPYQRLLHSYGKSFPDTVRAFAQDFNNAPDVVALPRSEDDVVAVLEWAADVRAAVIPFGGGSSVVGGVEPAVGDGFAGTVSLDLKGLDQILEVDRTSRAARIQGGILGPALEAALKPHGLTLRHFPQSFECSTLGGWIATRSGGHFATLFTHIDDFVESLRVVTPTGILESRRLPGSGAGPSPDRLMIGSEGALGVITEAWMRLQDRPTFRAGAAFAFDDFPAGARAMRAVAQAGLYPSNLRLVDAAECAANGVNEGSFTLLVLAFESADHPLDAWQSRALQMIQDHGGRLLPDTRAAEAWRTAFIRMPYQRELLVPRNLIVDTFETAITWDHLERFRAKVSGATAEAMREATGRDGLVTCRFTHAYPDGAAPYFTFHAAGRAGALIEQWRYIKQRASDAVIEGGGTITHHHAVGRDHMPWYERQRPALFGTALAAAKRALDPAGILNPGVLVPLEPR
jgi:alkyldihydroxyacetonephosphate synthase